MTLPSAIWQVKSMTSNSMKRIFVTGPANKCWLIVDRFVEILKEKQKMYLLAFYLRKAPIETISLFIKPQYATNKPLRSYVSFSQF